MATAQMSGRHYCHPSKLFYRFQMALFGIFCLTLQKITIYKGYEAFFDYYLSSDLFGLQRNW